jgi:thioredoxin-dependent peroxiredoxin
VVAKGAQVVGISVADVAPQRRFREEHGLPFPLLSDAGGEVARRYAGTIPLLGLAWRATFVVDQDGTVKQIITGSAAIDPAGAITSCPVH